MLTTLRRAEYAEIIVLFFLQGATMGMWFVPLSSVLEAHGLAAIRPFAFATSGIAAFVSPLFFGAMADRHVSPVRVLRGLAVASAAAMAVAATCIRAGAHPWAVVAAIQVYAFFSSPTWSISSTIIFARLADAQREFGPVRAMATVGWMTGCLVVSAMDADRSTLAGYMGAVMWLVVCAMTFWLPVLETPKSAAGLTWTQRLGLDALTLLRNRDHRVVFVVTTLFMIPLAAFYPFTPLHLAELGFTHTTAWMSLGQVTEILGMAVIGGMLARWRLKWIITTGLVFGVLRFVLCATSTPWGLAAGVFAHGGSFAFVFITAQIYLDQRIDPAWRGRAQALMSLMNGGVGNMIGYLGMGAWFAASGGFGTQRWTVFWSGLALISAAVLAVFLASYRGRGAGAAAREGH